jgi:hypothetical protein
MSWAEQESGATHMKTLSGTSLPQSQRSWLAPAVLAVVLGVAGMAIAMGIRRNGAKTTLATTTVAPGHGGGAVTEQRDFQLNVIGVPAGSRVRVNGVDATMPVRVRRGESARVEIEAAGYETWSQTVIPTGDVTMGFEPRAIQPPLRVPIASNSGAGADAAANADAAVTAISPPSQRSGVGRRHNGRHNLQGGVAPRPDF